MAYLIDTCVLRELHLPRPFWRVRRAVDDLWLEDVHMSVVTFAIMEGGAIRSVRGDRDDPFSRGHVCPKAAAIPDVVGDPDRVRTPLRRGRDSDRPDRPGRRAFLSSVRCATYHSKSADADEAAASAPPDPM